MLSYNRTSLHLKKCTYFVKLLRFLRQLAGMSQDLLNVRLQAGLPDPDDAVLGVAALLGRTHGEARKKLRKRPVRAVQLVQIPKPRYGIRPGGEYSEHQVRLLARVRPRVHEPEPVLAERDQRGHVLHLERAVDQHAERGDAALVRWVVLQVRLGLHQHVLLVLVGGVVAGRQDQVAAHGHRRAHVRQGDEAYDLDEFVHHERLAVEVGYFREGLLIPEQRVLVQLFAFIYWALIFVICGVV